MSVNGYSKTKLEKRALKRALPPINTKMLPTEFQAPARRMNRDQIETMMKSARDQREMESFYDSMFGL